MPVIQIQGTSRVLKGLITYYMYSTVQRENTKSAISSRKKSTVRRPDDRGQILSFSSPSRNHVEQLHFCTMYFINLRVQSISIVSQESEILSIC